MIHEPDRHTLPPEPATSPKLGAEIAQIAGVVLAVALLFSGAWLVTRTPSAPRPAAEPLPIVGAPR